MIFPSPPVSLFGIPLAVRRLDAQQAIDALGRLWQRQMGNSLGNLETDLDDLRKYFDPLARGERLRRVLSDLPPVPEARSRLLRDPLVLGIKNETLVTPEGRVAIAVLAELLQQSAADPLIIHPDLVRNAERLAASRYRKWGMRRIEDVLRLMTGDAESLRTSSIGWLLLLLVNGSRSPETAIRRLENPDDQEKLDRAVSRIIASFADALGPGSRNSRHFSLYQGYALTEARRRLPNALGKDGHYIARGQEDRVIDLIASELSRPHRSPEVSHALAAFDRLVETYHVERPRLAVIGVAHERRAETRQIRQHLEGSLERNRGRIRPVLPSDQDGE